MATKVVSEVTQSALEQAIRVLPNDFRIKGRSLGNKLKQVQVAGKTVKDEELAASGILEGLEQSTDIITKPDLVERLKNRVDIHKTTKIAKSESRFSSLVLKEFNFPEYSETIRRYNSAKNPRHVGNLGNHYSIQHINDPAYHQRGTYGYLAPADNPESIGQRGKIIFELQGDPQQYLTSRGSSLDHSYELGEKYAKEQIAVGKEIEDLNIKIMRATTEKEADRLRTLKKTAEKKLEYKYYQLDQSNINIIAIKDSITDTIKDVVTSKELHRLEEVALKDLNLPPKQARQFADDIAKVVDEEQQRAIDIYHRAGGSTSVDEINGTTIGFEATAEMNERISDKLQDVVNDLYDDPEIRKTLGSRFNPVDPDNTPFQNSVDRLNKQLDDELIETQENGGAFIAIPLETGSDDLSRAGYVSAKERKAGAESYSVQKYYETDVRKALIRKEKSLNADILKRNPDAGPDELFHYSEVKVPVSTKGIDRITDASSIDVFIDHRIDPLPTEELEDFAYRGLDIDEFRIEQDIIEIQNHIGNAPQNIEEAKRMALRNAIQEQFEELPAEESNKAIADYFDIESELTEHHVMGRLDLPKKFEPMSITLRGGDTAKIVPEWMTNLSSLYSAVPLVGIRFDQDYPIPYEADKKVPPYVIARALRAPDANKEKVADYLVNQQGYDREEVENKIDGIMKDRTKRLLDADFTPNQIFDELLARGYKPEDINQYLPNETILEDIYDMGTNINDMVASIANAALAPVTGMITGDESRDAQIVAAQVIGAEETVDAMWENPLAPFSRTMAIKAQHQVDALNISTMRELNQAGIRAQRASNGDIYVPDANGHFVPLDVEIFDIMAARSEEIIGAIGGANVGMRLGARGGPAGAIVGSLLGGGIGAASGNALSRIRNKLILKEEIETKFLVDEMVKAGAADALIASTLTTAFVLPTASLKAIANIWRKYGGNQAGANRALLEIKHVTPELADDTVADWERVNNKKLEGNVIEKRIAAFARGGADAQLITQPATARSSYAGINVGREINERAKDINKAISSTTTEGIGPLVADAMPRYIKRVQDLYNSTTEFAVAQMKNTGYTFDYDKLVIEPTLDAALDGITNPTIRKQANRLFSQIKAIGGKEIDTPAGKVTINNRRTFKELIELRELVADFGSKRSITKLKDVELVTNMLKNIDTEIRRAVRGNMEGADKWLKAYKPAAQALENMHIVEKNVLYKALTKTGATNKTVVNALIKHAESLDGTYREIMQALPATLRGPTEAAVLKGVIEKFTIGGEAGRQAVDLVALVKEIKHIPFSTKANQDFKRALGELARVFKSDPHILASTGTVKLDAFAAYLTDSPTARIRYAVITRIFNYITRLFPTAKGRETALVMATARALEKPADSARIADLMKRLPPDPAERNILRRQLRKIAEFDEKSTYPRVPVYSVQPKGHSAAPTKGPLGTGKYLYADKTKARAKSRISGGKLEETLLLEDRVADEVMIKEILGLPSHVEVTPSLVKNHPGLKEKLEGRGFSGILVNDTVMMF